MLRCQHSQIAIVFSRDQLLARLWLKNQQITLHRRSAISVDRKLGRLQFQRHAVDTKQVLIRSYVATKISRPASVLQVRAPQALINKNRFRPGSLPISGTHSTSRQRIRAHRA
jgi:hypothetical protein